VEFKKHALILGVIEGLNRHGSWTGKTHVQKAMALLNAKADIALPFQFVLYKHGPYSFDIEEELEQMKGYAAVVSESVPGYGVMLRAGEMAGFVKRQAPLSDQEKEAIERVSAFVGGGNVIELERIATAAWIRTREKIQDADRVVARLHELKPHVSMQEAAAAARRVALLLGSGK